MKNIKYIIIYIIERERERERRRTKPRKQSHLKLFFLLKCEIKSQFETISNSLVIIENYIVYKTHLKINY
jgi:hypothetical protein